MKHWEIDQSWTLFLDRDGVINQRIPGDYVKTWEDFQFCEGSLDAIVQLSRLFGRTVVVTNQQGIGKGLMSLEDLDLIHTQLKEAVDERGGKIDQIYFCPDLAKSTNSCRKPNPWMAQQAQKDFPEINFFRSIMIGDSISDMEFAFRLGMKTVFIEGKSEEQNESQLLSVDLRLETLNAFLPYCQ